MCVCWMRLTLQWAEIFWVQRFGYADRFKKKVCWSTLLVNLISCLNIYSGFILGRPIGSSFGLYVIEDHFKLLITDKNKQPIFASGIFCFLSRSGRTVDDTIVVHHAYSTQLSTMTCAAKKVRRSAHMKEIEPGCRGNCWHSTTQCSQINMLHPIKAAKLCIDCCHFRV